MDKISSPRAGEGATNRSPLPELARNGDLALVPTHFAYGINIGIPEGVGTEPAVDGGAVGGTVGPGAGFVPDGNIHETISSTLGTRHAIPSGAFSPSPEQVAG